MTTEVVSTSPDHELLRCVVGPLRTNSYVVRCATSGAALLVDPGDDPAAVADALVGAEPVAIVLTHAHWDHVQAVDALRARYGVPVLAHPAEAAVWAHELEHLRAHGQWDWALEAARTPRGGPPPCPGWDGVVDEAARGGATLPVGRLEVSVLHTPGHSPGSVCLLVGDDLLSGDTLFPGGPGLTGWPLSDFPSIMRSLTDVVFDLPDGVRVHPGHGAATTLGAERSHLEEWRARGW